MRRRHRDYVGCLVATAAPALQGSQAAAYLTPLEDEHDNLRAALTFAAASGASTALLQLAAGLWRFWYIHGHLSEERRLVAVALPLAVLSVAMLLSWSYWRRHKQLVAQRSHYRRQQRALSQTQLNAGDKPP